MTTNTPLNEVPQSPPEGQPVSSWPRVVGLAALVILLGVLGGRSILVMVAAFVVMIFLHELGHYLTAKSAGMKVTEFFLGFGPRIWSFRRGETEYGIKAIPAGAYVRIVGMSNLEPVDAEDELRTYRQKSYLRRLSVAVAGSTMHFLIALSLIFVLLAVMGTPGGTVFGTVDATTWVVGGVTPDGGAAVAGIRAGDRITAVAGSPISTVTDLRDVVGPRTGQTVAVVVQRGKERLTIDTEVRPLPDEPSRGFLGVRPEIPDQRLTPWAAVPATFVDFARVTSESVTSLGRLFTPAGVTGFARQVFAGGESATQKGEASGQQQANDDPGNGRLVSIYGATRLGAVLLDSGVADFLRFIAMLNVFIGMFNLVPLLPLDGGHVAIATYERIREGRSKRRYFADLTKLMPITYVVVLLLVTIGVSSLYLDIVNPIAFR